MEKTRIDFVRELLSRIESGVKMPYYYKVPGEFDIKKFMVSLSRHRSEYKECRDLRFSRFDDQIVIYRAEPYQWNQKRKDEYRLGGKKAKKETKIIHASVMSEDVYNGQFVPCKPDELSYTYTATMANVTCPKCREYITERMERTGVTAERFMKIW